MATSSRLKTADGKYYATEDYVKSYVNENIEDEFENINDSLSGKADVDTVYTKEEVQQIISGLFTMNTI